MVSLWLAGFAARHARAREAANVAAGAGVRSSQLLQEAGERAGAPAHKVVPPLLPGARHQRLQAKHGVSTE